MAIVEEITVRPVPSEHVVDTFRARHAPHLTRDAARLRLDEILLRARHVRTYPDGQQLWRGPRPEKARIVVDPARGVAITVLTPTGADPEWDRPASSLVRLTDGQGASVPGTTRVSALACPYCGCGVDGSNAKTTCGRTPCVNEHERRMRVWRGDPDPTAAIRGKAKRQRERVLREADPETAARHIAERTAQHRRWREENRDEYNRGHLARERARRWRASLDPEQAAKWTVAGDATITALARLLGGCLLCGAEPRAVVCMDAPSGGQRSAADVADLPETHWSRVMPACGDCAERWQRSAGTWQDHAALSPHGHHAVSASHEWACKQVRRGLAAVELARLESTRADRDWERYPSDVWAARAPVTGPYLPGVWREIRFDPEPRVMLPLEHAVPLHGLLSRALLSVYGHDRRKPSFSLVPWRGTRSGWSIYVDDGDLGRALSSEPRPGRLGSHPVGLGFGAQVIRPRTPPLPEPSRYRVRLTAMTPVVIRTGSNGATLLRGIPTASNLLASLTSAGFCERLRIQRSDVASAVLILPTGDRSVEMRTVATGGHLGDRTGPVTGTVSGWVGEMVIEVNAPGLWLLRCAEVVGLGGRTAYGFGCVRLSSVERQDAPTPHVP